VSPRARLVGLDVARALALLGMVATHLLLEIGPEGEQTWPHDLAGGRASALFAVLAGVTLALLTGRRTPLRGSDRWRASLGVVGRAVVIGLVGFWLGGFETGLAIILGYYALLFVLGLAFVGLRASALAAITAVWVVVVPVASHLLRPHLPERGFESPAFDQLAHPWQLLSELLLTGYYPVLPWLAYLLAGLALGRSDLTRRPLQAAWLAGGTLLALGAAALSRTLVATRFSEAERAEAALGYPGTTPTDGWDRLLLDAPHSATPFDLAVTIGSAVAVIGGCLLVVGLLPAFGQRVVSVVFGAGTMTLTLYTFHALLRADVWPAGSPDAFRNHVLTLALVGAFFAGFRWRGPLELVAGLPARWLRSRNQREPVGVP
jgi:hypothetical protein